MNQCLTVSFSWQMAPTNNQVLPVSASGRLLTPPNGWMNGTQLLFPFDSSSKVVVTFKWSAGHLLDSLDFNGKCL